MNRRFPPEFVAWLAASHERLVAAGLLKSYSIAPAADFGQVEWTPEAARLIEAGQPPLASPEFQALWARSDYAGMRNWLRRKAASLGKPRRAKRR